MLSDLQKIIAADRQAHGAVAAAENEAGSLLAQARSQVEDLKVRLQAELAQVRQSAQDDILKEAEARAGEIQAATARYIQGLREKEAAGKEEALALLVSRVLTA
ncbi:MAG: hypothetical protein FJ134_03515 [Deltaproteobacteria bacterium]|nr:hypothetical protein [Deltaproteobacteria bacterium]